MSFWEDLEMEINVCHRCNLEKIRKNPILGKGNNKSNIIFIFSSISELEDDKKDILIGKEQEYFKKFLEFSNFDISDVYATNIVKCSPRNNNLEKKNIDKCNFILETQIALLNPSIIVTVGEQPTEIFVDLKKNKFMDVIMKEINYNNITIIPIYDLRYLFKATDEEKWNLVEMLKNIKNQIIIKE